MRQLTPTEQVWPGSCSTDCGSPGRVVRVPRSLTYWTVSPRSLLCGSDCSSCDKACSMSCTTGTSCRLSVCPRCSPRRITKTLAFHGRATRSEETTFCFSTEFRVFFFGSDAFREMCCFRLELMCEAVPFPPSSEAKSEKRRREDESRDQTVNVKKMRSAIRCDHPRSSFAENSRFLLLFGAVCVASPYESEKFYKESPLSVSFRSKGGHQSAKTCVQGECESEGVSDSEIVVLTTAFFDS